MPSAFGQALPLHWTVHLAAGKAGRRPDGAATAAAPSPWSWSTISGPVLILCHSRVSDNAIFLSRSVNTSVLVWVSHALGKQRWERLSVIKSKLRKLNPFLDTALRTLTPCVVNEFCYELVAVFSFCPCTGAALFLDNAHNNSDQRRHRSMIRSTQSTSCLVRPKQWCRHGPRAFTTIGT
jgi:hypothetical protein